MFENNDYFDLQTLLFYSEEKEKTRFIREEDHDRSDEDSGDRLDMTINIEARDKEKRREAFHASQVVDKCNFSTWNFLGTVEIANIHAFLFCSASGSDSEHNLEEEEWEAQQIRKGVTSAQVILSFNNAILKENQNSMDKDKFGISNENKCRHFE